MHFRIFLVSIAVLPAMLISCGESRHDNTLRIIHAGSLTVPVREAADSFEISRPGVRILTEAWGSKAGARRISDLNMPCDVFISADYKVIDNFLIPEHASWNISFAGNEMAIVYNSSSRYAGEINLDNWLEILQRDDVVYGRSDPDSDPCGIRSVFLVQLAGILYDDPEIPDKILSRHRNMIRPKETDLLALLETGALDYIFLYRSVAEQHGLEFIVLPDELNLRDPGLNDWYARARLEVRGTIPGETMIEKAEAMVYGITIPCNTDNPDLANDFVGYFLSESGGLAIMERNGQHSLIPSISETWEQIPGELRQYALPVAGYPKCN